MLSGCRPQRIPARHQNTPIFVSLQRWEYCRKTSKNKRVAGGFQPGGANAPVGWAKLSLADSGGRHAIMLQCA
jgi:hypothetical protein